MKGLAGLDTSDQESPSGLGELLRRFRLRDGRSQSALAKALGFSASTINMLESGERRPSRDSVIAIARALSLSDGEMDQLLLAAHQMPTAFDRLSPADPDLQAVIAILASQVIPNDKKRYFRELIRAGAALCGPASER